MGFWDFLTRRKSDSPPSFQEQLDTFERLGFELNSEIRKVFIDELQDEEYFLKEPYSGLYMELGGTISNEPWTPFTDRVWDFDTEAIEDHGAYVEIIRNMQRLTRGEIKFDHLEDYVDLEEGKAWVSFEVNGEMYKWDMKVDDDWVDPDLFIELVGLTEKIATNGRFTVFETGGQNMVIGYETPEDRDKIVSATGLDIDWL